MNSLRFRPQLTQIEDRITPAVSAEQVVTALASTEASMGMLWYIGDHLHEAKTTREIELVAEITTNLTLLNRQNAQILAEYQADMQQQVAANPQLAGTLYPLLAQATQMQAAAAGLANISKVVAIGFGTPESVIDPPPPSPPPPPGSEPITGLNPNDASGMTDTFPDPNSPNFIDIGTGVKSWDIAIGEGDAVELTDTVRVFYTGWLASDGTQFETNRTGTPLVSSLLPTSTSGGLITGWQEGVPGMKPGGIRRLYIPAAKAYGAAGTSTIPPNSDLIFEIKLLTP